MPRAKGGPKTRHRRKKRLKLAKGQYGGKSRLFRTATESVDKGQAYAYTGRKNRKRDFRVLWIARINAAVRAHGLTYGRFINALKRPIFSWTGRFSPIWLSRMPRDLSSWSALPSNISPLPGHKRSDLPRTHFENLVVTGRRS